MIKITSRLIARLQIGSKILSVLLNQLTTGYTEMAKKMIENVKMQDGFLGVESARGNDGVGITVSYWKSLESINVWKNDKDHKAARNLGRTKWYDSFTVRICKIEREYGLERL